MNVKVIKLCPLYDSCPRVQAHRKLAEQIYSNRVEYIDFDFCPCPRRELGQRKGHFCVAKIDLDQTSLKTALNDVLKRRKKYIKNFYATEVDDFINRLKEMIKNDGRSSGES